MPIFGETSFLAGEQAKTVQELVRRKKLRNLPASVKREDG